MSSNRPDIDRSKSRARRALDYISKTNQRPNKADPLWQRCGLRDVLWSDIDLLSFRKATYYMRFRWILSLIFTANYFYDYLTDALMVWTLISEYWDTKRWLPVLYFVTVIISLVLFYEDIKITMKIRRSDDVSDTFMNAEALRFATFNFNKYCVVFKVLTKLKCMDKITRFMELALREWRRIVLVNVAQFILSAYALGLYQHNYGSIREVESASTSSWVMFTYSIKIVVLAWQVLWVIVGLITYPCIRVYMTTQLTNKAGVEVSKVSMRKYVTWRIDYRINQILGLVVDPKHPERQPVVLITGSDGRRRRLRLDEVTNYRHGPASQPQGCCNGAPPATPPAGGPPTLSMVPTMVPSTSNTSRQPSSEFHTIGIHGNESKTSSQQPSSSMQYIAQPQYPHPYIRYADPAVPPMTVHQPMYQPTAPASTSPTPANPPAYAPHPPDEESCQKDVPLHVASPPQKSFGSTLTVPNGAPSMVHRNSAPSAVPAPAPPRQPAVYVMYHPNQSSPHHINPNQSHPTNTQAGVRYQYSQPQAMPPTHQHRASYPPPQYSSSSLPVPPSQYTYGQYITAQADTPRYGVTTTASCTRCHTKLTLPLSMARGQMIQCPQCSLQWMY